MPCFCEHTEEEHDSKGFLKECLVEGCDCPDYDEEELLIEGDLDELDLEEEELYQ